MGFIAISLVLACLLFWGGVLTLITKNIWLVRFFDLLLKMTLTFVIISLVLFVFRLIGNYIFRHERRDRHSDLNLNNDDTSQNNQ